jgi:hypothetical protein
MIAALICLFRDHRWVSTYHGIAAIFMECSRCGAGKMESRTRS